MKGPLVYVVSAIVAAGLVAAGCTPAAPAPTPTKAAAPSTQAAAPPTKAPVEPTKAPAAPQPTAAPAKKVDFPIKGKSITLIISWAAGGAIDSIGRIMSPVMQKDLGVPVEVVNKPGASSQIGLTELANSKPDGHTLAIIAMPTGPVTYLDAERKASYGRKDLQPVALQGVDPEVVVVRDESPFKSLKDLADAAKANPGKLSVGNSGILGDNHLATILFQKAAGVQFSIVQFDGTALALPPLLGGHIDFLLAPAGNFTAVYKDKKIRMLGVMDKEESKFYPGVPTFRSQGYNIDFASSRGFIVAGGTSKEIVEILSSSIKKAMEDAEVKKRFDEMNLPVRYMNTDQFTAYWDELERQLPELLQMGKAETKK